MNSETTFFSYSRSDSDFALRLAKDLRKAGANIWMDQLDIEPGSRWDISIENSLDVCKRLLVIISPDAISSHNVMDEVSFALEENKKILPVLLIPCKIPFRLRRVQRIDFTKNYEAGIDKLLSLLHIDNETSLKAETPSDKLDKEDQIPGDDKSSEKSIKATVASPIFQDREVGNQQTASTKRIKPDSGITKNASVSIAKTVVQKSYWPLAENSKIILLISIVVAILGLITWDSFFKGNDSSEQIDDHFEIADEVDFEEVQLWKTALNSNSIGDFQQYRQKYPNGVFYEQAKNKIDSIEKNQPPIITISEEPIEIEHSEVQEDEEDVDVPFAVIEDVPIFPGCEGSSDKRACFNEMMQNHIQKQFHYPEIAQEMGVQGRVNVMFTIQKDGSIGNITSRGPDKNLEAEALRIIKLLPKMKPGKQRGRAVRVPFSIPITFKL